MENGPVEDVFPIKNGDFSIAMLVYWRVRQLNKHTAGQFIMTPWPESAILGLGFPVNGHAVNCPVGLGIDRWAPGNLGVLVTLGYRIPLRPTTF